MHLKTGNGILCGMRGDNTKDRDLVDCKRCLRMIDRVTISPSRIGKIVDGATGKRAVGEVLEEAVVTAVKSSIKKDGKKSLAAKRNGKEFPLCLCGCVDEKGERQHTKGGRFRPGHDAKYHAALNPKPVRPVKEKVIREPKPQLTKDHAIDTVLGSIKHFNSDQMSIFFRVLNERYGMGAVQVA